jgi:eukaryotic-like serine/threonine-protein kinase
MTIVSSGALFDVLRQYNLLSTQQLHEVLGLAQGRCTDVRMLAKTLIHKGWFSVYQVNQILAGNGKDLTLGPYHILDRLGKGGQSEVYKARHPEYGWTVALKVIRSDRLAGPEGAKQFLAEMEAMAELEHPNIVQFWDADKTGDTFYCAMEFVEGTDLGKVVRLQGSLPPALAAEYIRQTALGLQHAHEHNLVHRDIKPVNLYLTHQAVAAPATLVLPSQPQPPTEGQPLIKILDWGLASLGPSGDSGNQIQNNEGGNSIVGTADYLSPEQAMNPRTVDIRGDLYSLGCTFYYLLTGQTPFDGATVMHKVLQHQMAEPPPVESLNPDVPAGLCAIVRRLMAKKPENRFQTPAAVALALAPFCRADQGVARRRNPQPRPSAERGQCHEDTPLTSRTIAPGQAARKD